MAEQTYALAANGVYGQANGVYQDALSTIPDSGLLHNYDWSDDATTTSTVPDLAGSTDLTGSFTSLNDTINGVQAGEFDGTDDNVDGDYPDLSEPYDIYLVAQFPSSQNVSNPVVYDGFSNTHQLFLNSVSTFDLFQSSVVTGPSFTTDNAILTAQFGSTDKIRLNGTQGGSGDAGSSSSDGLTVGSSAADDNYIVASIGQMLVYDPSASGYSVSDVESYLSDKWGIAV